MRESIENELNSANDNPIIDADGERVLLWRAFLWRPYRLCHGQHEKCRGKHGRSAGPADGAAGRRRYNNGLPANLVRRHGPRAAINHGLKGLQISVSAWTAEALKLTMPASVFSRSTECHNQDKVSMGTIAARDGLRVLELTEQVAAALLITVRQGVWLRCQLNGASVAATAADVDDGCPGRRYPRHRRRPQARIGAAFIAGAHR